MKKYDDDASLSLYLKEINKIPLLTREEEKEISRKAVAGDKAAQAKLVVANLRFVVNTAKRYQNQGLPLEDLVSEGNVGLLNAIDRFDPEKGYHFISYAVWWIRQAILKAIYEKSRMIRLPLNRANELVQIEKVKKELQMELGEDPPTSEISRITRINETDVKDLLSISRDLISLESPVYSEQNSATLGEYIEDTAQTSPDEHAMRNSLKSDIESVLSTLPEKEAEIIRKRFGLGEKQPLSLKDIGEQYGLTKERIRQIEKKAITMLQHPSRSRYLRDYFVA